MPSAQYRHSQQDSLHCLESLCVALNRGHHVYHLHQCPEVSSSSQTATSCQVPLQGVCSFSFCPFSDFSGLNGVKTKIQFFFQFFIFVFSSSIFLFLSIVPFFAHFFMFPVFVMIFHFSPTLLCFFFFLWFFLDRIGALPLRARENRFFNHRKDSQITHMFWPLSGV